MKLMNEIEAEVSGQVMEILVAKWRTCRIWSTFDEN